MQNIFSYQKLFGLLKEKKILINFSPENIENLIKIANNNKLNEQEVFNIIEDCIDYGKLDYIKLGVKAKKVRDSKVKKESNIDENKLVKEFNSASFEKFLKKLNNGILSKSELKMMYRLKETTKLENGVINVLVGHGINENQGSVPSYEYFLKIASEWVRKDITTTKKAIENVVEYRKKKEEYRDPSNLGASKYVRKSYKKKISKSPDWTNQAIDDLFKDEVEYETNE